MASIFALQIFLVPIYTKSCFATLRKVMDIKKWIFTLCAMLCTVLARAQFDTHFTHYWALQGYYNPAVAGLSGRLNMYGTYAMQMAKCPFDLQFLTWDFS